MGVPAATAPEDIFWAGKCRTHHALFAVDARLRRTSTSYRAFGRNVVRKSAGNPTTARTDYEFATVAGNPIAA